MSRWLRVAWTINDVVENGVYDGIPYFIKQIGNEYMTYFTAYLVIDKYYNVDEGFPFGFNEITFTKDINNVNWIKDKTLGKYVIGWDYAHAGQEDTTINDVKNDVIDTITEYNSREKESNND